MSAFFGVDRGPPPPPDWVPPWEAWPTKRCAVRGCPEPRMLETRRRDGRLVTLPRRWCKVHCRLRAAEVQRPDPNRVLSFPVPSPSERP